MSEYRARLAEHKRHRRLGCAIRITAVVVAIVVTSVSLSVLPRIPVVATIAFYALAVLIFGAVERALRLVFGYQREKAAVQHLRSDTQTFSPDLPTRESD